MNKIQEMKNRLAAISAELKQFDGADSYTDEDHTKIENLSAEFETLNKKIDTAEKVASIQAKSVTPVERKAAGAVADVSAAALTSQKDLSGGFSNMGEFLMAVKNHAGGKADKRFSNTMFEKNAEDGGILVPETFLTAIKKKFESDESLLSKTTQITVAGNTLSLPIDEQAPWNGGVQAYWTAEGAPIQESKFKLGTASWRLNKLAALVKVTDELLEDAVGLESYMKAKAPEAMMWKLNSAIISGDGVGKPKGILQSPSRVIVPKVVGQAADTVVTKNILAMYSRMIPSARSKAVWLMNAAAEASLLTLQDDDGKYIYLSPGAQLNQSPYGLLLGRPVIPLMAAMPQLGDEGDIIFVDLSYYYTIVKSSGIKEAISTHIYFDRDISAYRWTFRVDGSCPFAAPVTTEFGNFQMSSIVTLEAR